MGAAAGPRHAGVLGSVPGDTVVGMNEKPCDLVLWACGVTEGYPARKAGEAVEIYEEHRTFCKWCYLKNTMKDCRSTHSNS